MSDSLSQFEDQLRRLAPAGCDHLTEETFYQAGWNAALRSVSKQAPASLPRRLPVIQFASGLLCGLLLCAASIAVWTSTQQDVSVVEARPVQSSPVQDLVVPPTIQSDHGMEAGTVEQIQGVLPQENDLFAISGKLWPWNWNRAAVHQHTIPLASVPLSEAARHQWNNIVAAELSGTVLQAQFESTTPASSERQQLRAFPSTESVIDELL